MNMRLALNCISWRYLESDEHETGLEIKGMVLRGNQAFGKGCYRFLAWTCLVARSFGWRPSSMFIFLFSGFIVPWKVLWSSPLWSVSFLLFKSLESLGCDFSGEDEY
jgi:hypothetical protein